MNSRDIFNEFARRHRYNIWHPNGPDLTELISVARDSAVAMHRPGAIASRNSNGDEWCVEAHYVDLACPPNAFVGKNGNVYCVAMPYTTAVHFYCLCRMLFRDPNLFPFIQASDLAPPQSIAYPPIPQPQDVQLEFLDACRPTDPGRRVMADWLASIALELIWHHEFGHIINGHIDYAADRGLKSIVVEAGDPEVLALAEGGLPESHMMEIYADMFSFQPVIRRLLHQHADPEKPQFISRIQHAAMLRFAFFLVNATWCLGDIAHYNELSAPMRARSHPPSAYRLFFGNENFSDVLKAYGVDDTTIEASDELSQKTIRYICSTYDEFGLVAAAIMKTKDENFTYAYRMKSPAEYFAKWAPFNFYPKPPSAWEG